MEDRDSSGLSNEQIHMQSAAGSHFGIIFRGNQNYHSSSMPSAPESPMPVHAPAAMRPLIACVNSPNSAGHGYNDSLTAIVPHSMGVGMGSCDQPVKRKRGRPRKYGDGASGNTALGLTPYPQAEKAGKGKGGSGKKQQLAALGSSGQDFTPHVIMIAAGEDVATKIMTFCYVGPRAVCVLSANGAISNVTLRQPCMSGGTVTYEGRFEILSLSGSFLLTENGGTKTRSGGLSVSLAGSDGHVVGGSVAGLLMAATPVQVIVGSFIAEGKKNNNRAATGTGNADGEVTTGELASPNGEATAPRCASPASSPLNESQGGVSSNTAMSQMQCLANQQSMAWAASSGHHFMVDGRRTDINISLPTG